MPFPVKQVFHYLSFDPLRTVKVIYFSHIKHVYFSPVSCPIFVKTESIIAHNTWELDCFLHFSLMFRNYLILHSNFSCLYYSSPSPGDFYPIQIFPIIKELSVRITICSVSLSPLSSYILLPGSNGLFMSFDHAYLLSHQTVQCSHCEAEHYCMNNF